jgi:hypothetical protein
MMMNHFMRQPSLQRQDTGAHSTANPVETTAKTFGRL